ncbi:hypothetical protein GH714_038891 [Hevea brasiliensis]|uniref:Uncharacterized protein n=1 Tax=Hevea brasiliensis TaxID=3981 RepID=A0A6A6KGJ6_HEVBR|nr:hypothetical protein GH714_038891 [Hevea brasiliensis]
MAGSHEDVESWLPTEFLTEEELLMDKENFINNGLSSEFKPAGFSFPTEFPYEFELKGSSASLSSPDESVVGSSEIENCDEDDFLAGLTRRLTQQFTVKPDNWVMAGSPESTLSGIGSWSVSSNGSPNGVLSPPTTPFRAKNDTWDLIYAAAGQVARLKMSNEGNKYNDRQGRGLLGTVRSQHADTILKNQNPGLYSSQSFNHSVSQMNQQLSSTGMRAVFLGGSGVKRECAGTGVFLPRRYGNPPDSKKKSACSTVLLPAKVVQALNLNFEDMNMNNQAQVQPRINCTFASDYDALMARRNVLLAQQKRNLRAEGVLNHEGKDYGWKWGGLCLSMFIHNPQMLVKRATMDKQNAYNTDFKSNFCFPDEFPYEFGSSFDLSSPVESVKKWVTARSPESTLSGIGSWSLSSNGSSNCEISPPATPFGTKSDPWDLIFAAGGPVSRLKVSSEGNRNSNYQERGLQGPARSQRPDTDTAGKNQNNGVSLLNQYQVKQEQRPSVWGWQQMKGSWQDELQPHQQLQQQHQIQSSGRSVRPLDLPRSAWPPLQVQPNHHMHQHYYSAKRATFLGGSCARKECAGTGVFLPRRCVIPADCKKKSACSTVLVQAKVVQALDLNLKDMNIQDALMARNGLLAQQKGNLRAESVLNNQEICLPQEWMY